jgi:enterochelin esterase family protein
MRTFRILRQVLILGLIMFSACTAHTPVAPTPGPSSIGLACDDPAGTVERLSLDQASRGYTYYFGLYLPPCYQVETQRTYPVVYFIPGRASGPTTWFAAGAAQAADELILNKEVPPFIIVTTETTDADMFAEIILNELVPFIEKSYRVSPERRHHAVAGGSLGGVGAYRMVLGNPDRFASAAIFGSGAISGEEAQIRGWLKALTPETELRLFFNCGEGDPLMLDRARVMISLLDEAGVPHHEIFGDGGHSYSYWASNLPAYYRWLAEAW